MPARRRFTGSESDDNFSVLIDGGGGGGGGGGAALDNQFVENNFSGDEKKKYAAQAKSFYSVAGFSVPTAFAVPKGLSQFSSSIGTFLHQNLIQPDNDNASLIQSAATLSTAPNDRTSVAAAAAVAATTDRNSLLAFDDNDDDQLIVMACRDRTAEFASVIRAAQARNIARAVNVRDPRRATQIQSYSEFMMIAKHIGRNIASTYSKLEKLTLCEYTDMLSPAAPHALMTGMAGRICRNTLTVIA